MVFENIFVFMFVFKVCLLKPCKSISLPTFYYKQNAVGPRPTATAKEICSLLLFIGYIKHETF